MIRLFRRQPLQLDRPNWKCADEAQRARLEARVAIQILRLGDQWAGAGHNSQVRGVEQ